MTISTRIDRELNEELDKWAKDYGRTKSSMIESCLGLAIENYKDEASQGDLLRHLEVDAPEAAIVNTIYQLYLTGHNGRSSGVKSIAAYLNDSGITMRGTNWKLTTLRRPFPTVLIWENMFSTKRTAAPRKYNRSPNGSP